MAKHVNRPEPVLDAAKLASAVSGLVLAVGLIFVTLGMTTHDDVTNWASIAGGIVTALGTMLAVILPYIQAMKAREQVTPLADPVDNIGRALVPAPDLDQPNAPHYSGH